MLEIAIVGGGMSGLALGVRLQEKAKDFALFEARGRLGGRVLSRPFASTGIEADLGATWIWPAREPSIVALIDTLGLDIVPQPDDGQVLELADPDKQPVQMSQSIHHGAYRVAGGMGALIDALAARLDPARVHLGYALIEMADKGDHVALTFASGDEMETVTARQVVLALPPRLVDEQVMVTPAFDDAFAQSLREAPTWMAREAKLVAAYDQPFWRESDLAGSAFVTHEQAVLAEVFDASGLEDAALGGFLALGPELRWSFATGLRMLMSNQLMQLFGPQAETSDFLYQDWAGEHFTCARRDLEAEGPVRPEIASPLLRRAYWQGKLHLAGTETAARGRGHLEGALDAADRVAQRLTQDASVQEDRRAAHDDAVRPFYEVENAGPLTAFESWVATQTDAAFDAYHQELKRRLMSGEHEGMTQDAVVAAASRIFDKALRELAALEFVTAAVPVEKGRSALTPAVQRPFGFLLETLIADVVAFNRSSCALSTFPEEHRLSDGYQDAIRRSLIPAWRDFSLAANRRLLALPVGVPQMPAGDRQMGAGR